MDKHFSFFMLLITFLGITLVSCNENYGEYIRPQYGSITCTPSPVIAGDSVELVVPQKSLGNGIAATTYTWVIKDIGWDEETNASKDSVITVEDNYDGLGKRDPCVKFLVPANWVKGNHAVTMTATFSVYIGNTLFDKVSANGRMVIE